MRDEIATWAAAHLSGDRIALPPLTVEALDRAVVTLGVGIDHLVGEEVLALVDESSGSGAFTLGVLVTDARLLVRAEGRTTVVPYAALEGAEALEGLVTTGLKVQWGGSAARWPFGNQTAQAIAAFVATIVEAPPDTRTPAPRGLVQPSVLDSSGLAGVRAALQSSDPRPPVLVDVALEAQKTGAMTPEIARDFAARAALYDRTLAMGRGAHDGWWLSPLGGPDLLHALSAILGPPASVADISGVRTADFRVGGWGGVVRCRISPTTGLTAFSPGTDGGRPLSESAPDRLRALFAGLVPIEGRGLLRRLVSGWDPTPEALAAVPVATIETRVREAVGSFDLAATFGLP